MGEIVVHTGGARGKLWCMPECLRDNYGDLGSLEKIVVIGGNRMFREESKLRENMTFGKSSGKVWGIGRSQG